VVPAIGEILEEMIRPRLERAGSDHETQQLSASIQRILQFFAETMPDEVTAAMLENYWRYNDRDDREDGNKTPSRCARDLRLMRQAILTHAKRHQTPAPGIFERFWPW
jgi:hypothetical protein